MALEFWLLVGRAICLLLATIAMTVIMKAPNMNFVSSFVFLAVASCVEMTWNAAGVLFQIACLWFGRAQPSDTALIVLTVFQMVFTTTTMAAGCSALGVAVLCGVDTDNCRRYLPASACAMYFTASTLAVVVGILGFLIASGMLWVWWHRPMVI